MQIRFLWLLVISQSLFAWNFQKKVHPNLNDLFRDIINTPDTSEWVRAVDCVLEYPADEQENTKKTLFCLQTQKPNAEVFADSMNTTKYSIH